MSDDFIPLNQSTPSRGGYRGRNRISDRHFNGHQRFHHQRDSPKRYNHRGGGNGSRDNSRGSNRFNMHDDITSFVHPAMLEDPWEKLRKQLDNKNDTEQHSTNDGDTSKANNVT